MAAGIGKAEASLIVEEGTELVFMLRDAKGFVEVHFVNEEGVGGESASRPPRRSRAVRLFLRSSGQVLYGLGGPDGGLVRPV